MIQTLKCYPEHFEAICLGTKRFEYRVFDRPYELDDILELKEYRSSDRTCTGRVVFVKVLYIYLPGSFSEDLPEYVIMSISEPLGLSRVQNKLNLESN